MNSNNRIMPVDYKTHNVIISIIDKTIMHTIWMETDQATWIVTNTATSSATGRATVEFLNEL